jgi:hypothetical protein
VVSPLSVVENRGKKRLILDLRYVNRAIHDKSDEDAVSPYKFKYESLHDLPTVAREQDLMFSIDLESAYHHVDIHRDSWTYLGFQWEGRYYEFCVLPFGLNVACWVFTKITRVLAGHWRGKGIRLLHYLDDFLFFVRRTGDSSHRLFYVTQKTVLQDIQRGGFSVSERKCELDPSMLRQWLGFVVDTEGNRVTVSPLRVEELRDTLHALLSIRARRTVPARQLARACGQLASMHLALGAIVGVYTRDMYARLDTVPINHHVALDAASVRELQFWQQHFHEYNGNPIWRPSTRVTAMWTDASDFGWAGLLDDARQPTATAHGYFTAAESAESSTHREMLATSYSLASLPGLDNRRVLNLSDNQSWGWIAQKGSRIPSLNELAKVIVATCRRRGIELTVEWIPRELNQQADDLSKFYDWDDWKLNPQWFRRLDGQWGPHTVDRFASHLNHHLPRFNALHWSPDVEHVDAFTRHWGHPENNWCNPPFGLIGHVLQHMQDCGAAGTLICPHWRTRPWWHWVCPDGHNFAPYIVDWIQLPRADDLFLPGPKHGNSRGIGSPRWEVYALRVDFSR